MLEQVHQSQNQSCLTGEREGGSSRKWTYQALKVGTPGLESYPQHLEDDKCFDFHRAPCERRIIAPFLSECCKGQMGHTVCSCSANGSPFPFFHHLVKACPDHIHRGFTVVLFLLYSKASLPVAFQQGFVTEGS